MQRTPARPAPCLPPSWARGGHAQTILGHFLPSTPILAAEELRGPRYEIPLADGDRLVGTRIDGDSELVVYLFHGLGADITSSYMSRAAAVARGRFGATVYLTNHRGCGEGRGLARRPYHSGIAEDLSAVIRHGRAENPGKRHLAMGFSLSANALLLLLSGKRGDTQPDYAMAFNGPIDIAHTARLIQKGFNRVYDLNFVQDFRRELADKKRAGLLKREVRLPLRTTVHDFDALYTAPEAGFDSREHYYESCSTRSLLKLIRVPTLVMTAKDDPFIDYHLYEGVEVSPTVTMHIEEYGGHLGYLTRETTPLGTNRWLDYAIWHYLGQLTGLRDSETRDSQM